MCYAQISFQIAPSQSEKKFSHFISVAGDIMLVDRDAVIAKVGVMAETAKDVTEEQRDSIINLCVYATQLNKDVSLTFGGGLSPFNKVPIVVEGTVINEPVTLPAN